MTDLPPTSGSFFQQRPSAPPEPVFARGDDERMIPLVIYILYLIPIGITHIVGLVMAYVARDTAPEWLRSHYNFQIRTFWIGLLYLCIAGVLCVVLIGFVLVPVVVIWFIVRCALGLVRLSQGQAYPTPYSWTL
jgi:uncharacterized membrane protein